MMVLHASLEIISKIHASIISKVRVQEHILLDIYYLNIILGRNHTHNYMCDF